MIEGVNELVEGELRAIQALLDDSDNWSRAVQTRILELREGTEDLVHEREVVLNNDDNSSLLEIDQSRSPRECQRLHFHIFLEFLRLSLSLPQLTHPASGVYTLNRLSVSAPQWLFS